MGRRTAAMLDFIRFLRTTAPKHSFEVFIFQIMLGIACITFAILGENRLWGITFAVLCFSLGIQYWRVRRVVQLQLQVEQAWLIERMTRQMEQAIADYERLCAQNHTTPDPAVITRLCEDVEWAWLESVAPGKCDACAVRRDPLDPAELALLREAVEQAREREAAG